MASLTWLTNFLTFTGLSASPASISSHGNPSIHHTADLNILHFFQEPRSLLLQGFSCAVPPASLPRATLPSEANPSLSYLSIRPLYSLHALQKASPHPWNLQRLRWGPPLGPVKAAAKSGMFPARYTVTTAVPGTHEGLPNYVLQPLLHTSGSRQMAGAGRREREREERTGQPSSLSFLATQQNCFIEILTPRHHSRNFDSLDLR